METKYNLQEITTTLELATIHHDLLEIKKFTLTNHAKPTGKMLVGVFWVFQGIF